MSIWVAYMIVAFALWMAFCSERRQRLPRFVPSGQFVSPARWPAATPRVLASWSPPQPYDSRLWTGKPVEIERAFYDPGIDVRDTDREIDLSDIPEAGEDWFRRASLRFHGDGKPFGAGGTGGAY